jgi:hypothetical protein
MGFAVDNKKAKKFETLVFDFITNCGLEPRFNDKKENYSYYDIIVDKPVEITFEVKADFMSSVTGNLAIEHHNSKKDKPSGIMISTATYWCHVIYEKKIPTIYLANRLDLLKFMEAVEPFKKIIGGGDSNANLYLYKKAVLLGEYKSDKPLQKMNSLQFKETINVV